jgi:hypothetical protein
MSRQRTLLLCPALALGCGPCELLAGHDGRHLCEHYARNGVEYHDEHDKACRCHWCENHPGWRTRAWAIATSP